MGSNHQQRRNQSRNERRKASRKHTLESALVAEVLTNSAVVRALRQHQQQQQQQQPPPLLAPLPLLPLATELGGGFVPLAPPAPALEVAGSPESTSRKSVRAQRRKARRELQRKLKGDAAAAAAAAAADDDGSSNSGESDAGAPQRLSRESPARRARVDRSGAAAPVSAAPVTTSPQAPPSTAAEQPSTRPHALEAHMRALLRVLQPTSADHARASAVLDDVRRTLSAARAEVAVYGSLRTGLALPSSDIDLFVSFRQEGDTDGDSADSDERDLRNMPPQFRGDAATNPRSKAFAIRELLRRSRGTFHSVLAIAHAAVPIVKCVHAATRSAVDLSFQHDGILTSNYLNARFRLPVNAMARGLIVLVKALLRAWDLDDPSRGGMGSFVVSLLVLWFLEAEVARSYPPEMQRSYAVLLAGFLDFYGTQFTFRTSGIHYDQGRSFTKPNTTELVVTNPLDPSRNAAKACTLFANEIRPAFARAGEGILGACRASIEAAVQRRFDPCTAFFASFQKSLRALRPGVFEAALRAELQAPAAGPGAQQNVWLDSNPSLYSGGYLAD